MAMTRVGAVVVGIGLFIAAGACSTKPSEEACEKAVNNIRKLTGQSHTDVGADKRAAIRSCRAQSSKDTVECMAEARTSQELFACGGKMAEEVKKFVESQKKAGAGAGGGAAAGGGDGAAAGGGAAAPPPTEPPKEPGKGP